MNNDDDDNERDEPHMTATAICTTTTMIYQLLVYAFFDGMTLASGVASVADTSG